jgi:hypothetical protein
LTHDGPFPGRPRGRRARHDNDVSDWSGYDATQQDQREFPDLPPIRPNQARPGGGHARGDWQGQQGQQGQQPQPGQGGWQSGGGGYLSDDPGYQVGAPGYPPVGPGGPGGPGQQWSQQGQNAPGQQAQGQQAMSQPGLGQSPRVKEREDDIPAWAEPDSVEAFSARWHRRGLDSRGERRSDRRKRRRVLIWAGGVAAVVVAVAVYFLMDSGGGGSANLGFGSLVTTFLPGELQSVPDACGTVPSTMLGEFLPGTLKQAAPPLNTGDNTECTWTLDNPPTYRVLEVQMEAYTPSPLVENGNGTGLVSEGNGSATFAAVSAMSSFQYEFAHPAAKSGEPVGIVTNVSGMPGGNETSAFEATQVFDRNGATTDVADVLVRYRNVIVTVEVDGLDQANGNKKYGPVAMSDLSTAAKTVAKEVAGKIVG